MKSFTAILITTLTLALGGCGSDQEVVNENGWPKKLIFAFTPDEEEPGKREKVYEMLSNYLEDQLGIEVVVRKTSSYAPVIEALRARKVDMSNLSTFTYMIAQKKADVEPLVARTFLDGSPRVYHSIFITSAESEWADLDNLLEASDSVRFAFVNPASTSGHLIPRATLEQMGIVPETDFKELVYPGSQSATILSVLSGQVDAAAVADGNLRKLIRTGKVKENSLRILGKSAPIPSSCLAIRSDLPDSLKETIRQAYLNLPTHAPELDQSMKALSNRYLKDPLGDYVVINDRHYDELRKLSQTIESLAMLR